jgi:hypothetical protein
MTNIKTIRPVAVADTTLLLLVLVTAVVHYVIGKIADELG